MTNETETHRVMREAAVGRARTEVDRRRRLRAMADAGEAIDTDRAVAFASAKDELEPEHLLAAALGELHGRPDGTKTLVFPTEVAVLSLDLRDGTR